MKYTDIIAEDRDRVKSLHKRVSDMVHGLNLLPEEWLCHSEKYSHAQCAYDLFYLCVGIRWYDKHDDSDWCGLRTFSFPFESLDELELKLVVMGF